MGHANTFLVGFFWRIFPRPDISDDPGAPLHKNGEVFEKQKRTQHFDQLQSDNESMTDAKKAVSIFPYVELLLELSP